MVETATHAATRTSRAVAQPAEQTPLDELKASLRKLLATLMDRAFGLALRHDRFGASATAETARLPPM